MAFTPGDAAAHVLTDSQLRTVQQIADSIQYGTVTLVIQDGRLIQIDRSEKIRIKREHHQR